MIEFKRYKNLYILFTFLPTLLFAQNPCNLTPAFAPCMAAIPAYYYNQETQQCQMFVSGGCGIIPFNNLESCEEADCGNLIVDSCVAVPIEGCFTYHYGILYVAAMAKPIQMLQNQLVILFSTSLKESAELLTIF